MKRQPTPTVLPERTDPCARLYFAFALSINSCCFGLKGSEYMNREHLDTINDMIKDIERLPEHALMVSVNHYDWLRMLYLLKAVLADSVEKSSLEQQAVL